MQAESDMLADILNSSNTSSVIRLSTIFSELRTGALYPRCKYSGTHGNGKVVSPHALLVGLARIVYTHRT